MSNITTALEQKISQINSEISSTEKPLPFEYQQAYSFSTWYASKYLAGKTMFQNSPSSSVSAILAVARYEWIIQNSVKSLSKLFTEADVIALLDCHQGDIFIPDQFNSIASDLCDHLGIEIDDYESSDVAQLINKLRGLSPVQRAVLAEVLEHLWNTDMRAGLNIEDALAARGIQLL
ncbi:hypothetical protein [Roseateles albus]|uniref:Uncharacterized protein n=1 Tax=Roseateles albus TaxID=2987525 RepID=A0ABT5KCU3_9BURK|nr:hypothetical protein [Roseateles albus]MDC8771742.1 hypothetical protein [Roseateles albus]